MYFKEEKKRSEEGIYHIMIRGIYDGRIKQGTEVDTG